MLQRQEVTARLPTSELVFAGHTKQVDTTVAAVALEYVPDWHSIHALTPGYPEYFPAGQSVHEDTVSEPPKLEYLPAGQL